MGISEMQRHFRAYGSGELPEYELRNFIRGAVSRDPQLSPEFIALVEAYHRANLIGSNLQSTINADIAEVTGPWPEINTGPAPHGASNKGWFVHARSANSTDVHDPYISNMEGVDGARGGIPTKVRGAATGRAGNTGAGLHDGGQFNAGNPVATTGSTGGSAWDTDERLAEVADPLCPGSVVRDRFELVEELGRGGMGVVYKAYDRSRGDTSERYVAIKVLNEEFKRHPLSVRALQREARKAQKLAHPNVVSVHDFDRDRGNVYMVMELLSGRSLDEVILTDGRGGIPLGPAMDIIRSLGAALSYAHEQGIVHCDFKPSNAFLSSDGKVKVLDFGIARAVPSLLEKGEITRFDAGQLGAISPAYASLEMLEQGAEPDVRDDVYAFACVAYEVLSGCHPYQRIDATKAYHSGLQPRVIRKLSRTQWRALRQGLEFRRADRCPSIDSLVSQLAAPRSRAKLWVAGTAVSLLVLMMAGALVWEWPALQQEAAKLHNPSPPVVLPKQTTQAPVPRPKPETSGAAPVSAPAQSAAASTPQVVQPAAQQDMGAPAAEEVQRPKQPDVGAASQEVVAMDRPQTPQGTPRAPEEKRIGIEMLQEKFEAQAAAGDVEGAAMTANALGRASAGSLYVTQKVPQILTGTYVHLAKTQFAGGQVDAALQTLKNGRKKFGRSPELRDLEARYVGAATLYDRLRSAVAVSVAETQHGLEALQAAEGDEYETAAQMLAQTLADRIADQRAANRAAVADRMLEAGKQIFPNFTELLQRGRAGMLPDAPLQVDDN